MLLVGKDTLEVLEARFDLKIILEFRVLEISKATCCAGHLMVPLLPDSSWEFDDTFVPSEAAGPLVFPTNVMSDAFSVKRLPGSRNIRDLMITSGRRACQGSIVLSDLCVRKRSL